MCSIQFLFKWNKVSFYVAEEVNYLCRTKETETPGPWSYETIGGFDTVIKNLTSAYSLRQLDNFKPSTSFASKVTRFKYKTKLERVGPGAYKVEQQAKWNAPWYANIGRQVSLKKSLQPTPPSIPSHDFVFGYEEISDGKVVKQKNPINNFSGNQDT